MNKKTYATEKKNFHPRSKHSDRYDFSKLVAACPELSPYVHLNKFNDESIDYSSPVAVLMLNKALLKFHYGINKWSIPKGYLCPPIPGRADYLHHVADLLAYSNQGKIPIGNQIHCLDIGVGANCIYPLIGYKEYGWSFTGIDTDIYAIESARNILTHNPDCSQHIQIIQQANPDHIFIGIPDKPYDLSICNPPFHASEQEAVAANIRKINNLKSQRNLKPHLNFGGKNNELWCEGGELAFIQKMINQSKDYSRKISWFTTLVSKQEHLPRIYQLLKKVEAIEVVTINMQHGNKSSRIVAWTFLSKEEHINRKP